MGDLAQELHGVALLLQRGRWAESAGPYTSTAFRRASSTGWPGRGDATTVPSTRSDDPVVTRPAPLRQQSREDHLLARSIADIRPAVAQSATPLPSRVSSPRLRAADFRSRLPRQLCPDVFAVGDKVGNLSKNNVSLVGRCFKLARGR